MSRCLYCYGELDAGQNDFHPACARKFFGTKDVPRLEYSLSEIDALAARIIGERTSLTGVQPKLSLNLMKHQGGGRLTIVGLWGDFICKPQSSYFSALPEVEDLTMHLAEIARIDVVPHTLMRMADGTLCYLTRRIDRTPTGGKVAMEDLCQLSGRLTEHKYMGSYERVAKTVAKFSSMPKLDVANIMEVVLLSWLTGNNDMHLKNFSLYETATGDVRLTPVYDLLNVAIVNPADDEELALTLNGRKKRITRADFIAAGISMGLFPVTVERMIEKFARLRPRMEAMIDKSMLGAGMKNSYRNLLCERLARIAAR